MSLLQSNLRKQIRKLPKILKSVKSIHYYSLFLILICVLTRHPPQPWRNSTALLVRRGPSARSVGDAGPRRRGLARLQATRRPIGKISAKCCSFSAVSAPIFARKYAFCSIFHNLPDYLAEIFEIWQYFANFATFAKCLLNFHENC